MDITSLSTCLAQETLQQSAALSVQKMSLDGARDQGAALVRMMDTAKTVTDPSVGSRIDLLA
jgi:hypothetical protein